MGGPRTGRRRFSKLVRKSRMELRRQVGQGRVEIGIDSGTELGPLGRGHRRAAVADAPCQLSAAWRLREPCSCSGFRMQQACGGGTETASATGARVPTSSQNKQQSGGQAVHDLFRPRG